MSALTKWNRFRKSDQLMRAVVVGALSVAVLAVSLIAADTRPKRAAQQVFMRQKLARSQGVLEGLALEKFDLVSKNAIHLRNMTHSNHWFTFRQTDYMTHTTNYQKSVHALYLAAVDKNLEAALEAYTKVARNCVECHRLVRTEQRQNASPPAKARNEPDLRPVIIP